MPKKLRGWGYRYIDPPFGKRMGVPVYRPPLRIGEDGGTGIATPPSGGGVADPLAHTPENAPRFLCSFNGGGVVDSLIPPIIQ